MRAHPFEVTGRHPPRTGAAPSPELDQSGSLRDDREELRERRGRSLGPPQAPIQGSPEVGRGA